MAKLARCSGNGQAISLVELITIEENIFSNGDYESYDEEKAISHYMEVDLKSHMALLDSGGIGAHWMTFLVEKSLRPAGDIFFFGAFNDLELLFVL